MSTPLRFTDHARSRMAARGLDEAEIRRVVTLGRKHRSGGRKGQTASLAFTFRGVVVITDRAEEAVITVWRLGEHPDRPPT